jgi:superfamily II DNA or RNA helicase
MTIELEQVEQAWSRPRGEERIPPDAELARLIRPCIRVWNEALWVDRGQGLQRELSELRAPVIALSFVYEGFVVRASEDRARIFCGQGGAMVARWRDRAAEMRARMLLESFGAIELELLEDYATAPGCDADYLVQPEAGAQAQCAFAASALEQLRALGWQVEVDADYPYRVLPDATWYATLEPAEDKPDWFGLELGVEIAGHRIDLLPVLLGMLDDAGKRVDLGAIEQHAPRFVQVPGQGGYVEVAAAHFRTLARVLAELYQGQGADACFPEVRAAALFELDQAFGRAGLGLQLGGGGVHGLRARAQGLIGPQPAADAAVVPSAALCATLRPYQQEGLAWLQRLRACGAGAVLADDMGLGKTLQLIAHLCAETDAGRAQRPSLVIAPTSLIGNWRRELLRFAPHLRVCVLFGSQRHAARAGLSQSDVALTSYSVLLRDAGLLGEHSYHCVVLDEAQAIKNPRSRAAQLAKTLDCEQRICLSGTPIENNLHELWSLLDFAVPGLLGSEEQFRHFYRLPIEQRGDAERLATLRSQVAPYLLRRMKEQVATELPKKTEVTRPVELRGKQRELYESIRIAAHEKVRSALRKKGVSGSTVTILAALTKLRQLCCDPRLVHGEQAREVQESAKYELLFELLQSQRAEGRRTLVFSQFASMLGLISLGLREHGIAHASLTGATTDRERPVRAFQRGDVDVFLISLKAGGTGLNLTGADTVIHYDPWWNPAAQDQATDRAHRIGQDKPVFVYSLIAAGSVEERMLALQQRKRRLASAVVTSGGQGAQPLCEAEVEHLLAPLDEG